MKETATPKIFGPNFTKRRAYFLGAIFLIILAAFGYFFFLAPKPLPLSKSKEIQARINVAPGVYHIGDMIPVSFEVEARTGISFAMPDLSNRGLGPLEILSKSNLLSKKFSDGIRQTINYQLTAWDAGIHSVKGFAIPYQTKSGAQRTYLVPSRSIHVQSLLPAGKSRQQLAVLAVKETKKPLSLPPRYSILGWLFAIVIICGLVWLIIQYRKRLRNKQKPPIEKAFQTGIVSEAADIIAFRRLAALEQKDYLGKQEYKPYYTELAECIREYLENRFQIRALEMTTEEFLGNVISNKTLGRTHQQLLTDFLQSADLVKFAKCLPLPAEAEKALTLTKQLIEETKEKPLERNEWTPEGREN